jgi:aarF domain-containing kinase
MSKYSHDLIGLLRGASLIASASIRCQERYLKHVWSHSSVREAIENGVKQTSDCTKKVINTPTQELQSINALVKESAERSAVVIEGLRQYMSSGRNSMPLGSVDLSQDEQSKSYSTIKNIQNLDIASITLKELENLLAEHNKIRDVNPKIGSEFKPIKSRKNKEEEPPKVQEIKKVVEPTPSVIKDEKLVENMMSFITNYDKKPVEEIVHKAVPEVSKIFTFSNCE